MRQLSRRVLPALAIALLALGCASTAPPRRASAAGATDLACRAATGSSDGLIIELYVPGDLPPDTVVAIFRDRDQLAASALSELGELPRTLLVGDAGVERGRLYRYTCGLWTETGPLDQRVFSAQGGRVPAVPAGPVLSVVGPGEVRVEWPAPDGSADAEESLWIEVLRRDVVAGGGPTAVSPDLAATSWLDRTARPGHVYAYSLRASRFYGDVRWSSPVGPERYIELPR